MFQFYFDQKAQILRHIPGLINFNPRRSTFLARLQIRGVLQAAIIVVVLAVDGLEVEVAVTALLRRRQAPVPDECVWLTVRHRAARFRATLVVVARTVALQRHELAALLEVLLEHVLDEDGRLEVVAADNLVLVHVNSGGLASGMITSTVRVEVAVANVLSNTQSKVK